MSKFNIIHESKVSSTNDFAKKLVLTEKADEFSVIIADEQIIGRGQRKNSWHSEANKNLTFSIIVYPTFLKAIEQFYLSKSISLGIIHYLNSKGKEFKIKWPNDIYFKDKKLCGILIENSISGINIKNSVIGIGLNMNQKKFPDDLAFADSLSNIIHTEFDILDELNELLEYIHNHYQNLKKLNFTHIDKIYHKNLYKINQVHQFRDSSGNFEGSITGTLPDGKLQIKTVNNGLKEYSFKEVEFL